jgi:hypothetical protein
MEGKHVPKISKAVFRAKGAQNRADLRRSARDVQPETRAANQSPLDLHMYSVRRSQYQVAVLFGKISSEFGRERLPQLTDFFRKQKLIGFIADRPNRPSVWSYLILP